MDSGSTGRARDVRASDLRWPGLVLKSTERNRLPQRELPVGGVNVSLSRRSGVCCFHSRLGNRAALHSAPAGAGDMTMR